MNTNELRRLRFFEAIRFVIALAVCFAVLAWAAFTQGCASPGELPPGAIDFVTNYAQRVVVAVREQTKDSATWSSGAEAGASSGVAGSTSSSTEEHTENTEGASTSSQTSVPSASSVVLDFRYGGVKAKPAEDSRCRLSRLAIGADSLSFHWDTGIPSDWKRGDTKKGPMILACAFYFDDASERWIGGKFDWIDEHRSGRSLENIHGGYGGWDGMSWTAAKKHAVCVVSADGKFRSNLITD